MTGEHLLKECGAGAWQPENKNRLSRGVPCAPTHDLSRMGIDDLLHERSVLLDLVTQGATLRTVRLIEVSKYLLVTCEVFQFLCQRKLEEDGFGRGPVLVELLGQ